MENFIDVCSSEELEDYYGYEPTAEDVARDRDFFRKNPDYNFRQLFLLYLDRGDRGKAQTFYDRIEDSRVRLDAAMINGDSRYEGV